MTDIPPRPHAMDTTAPTPVRDDGARALADAELVARAARGDPAAFEAIMRRHNRLLFRSARGIVDDDAEAQDVVQETYLRAFSRLDTFRGDAALGTWLARIAINVALDAQRRRGRGPSVAGFADLDLDSLEGSTMHDDPRRTAPDAAAERGEVRQLLQRAIDGLPPIYRSVFVLRAVQEMSVDETAFCLQVSEAVVKTRYLRARAMLRDAVGALLEPHIDGTYAFAGARCDAVVAYVLAAIDGRRRVDDPGAG